MGNILQHLVVLVFIKTLITELSVHSKLRNVELYQKTIQTRIYPRRTRKRR